MRILESRRISVKCKIVGGSGFGNSKPTRYVRKLHRRKATNTEFVGYTVGDSLAEQLRSADVFCCPSIWNDPFPLAPLEAMATGLPAVATNRGGLPEALAHGGGVLVPANDVAGLAAALQRLAEDEGYRKELADAAHASFRDHFLWSIIREQYQRVVRG